MYTTNIFLIVFYIYNKMRLLRITHNGHPGHERQIRMLTTQLRSIIPNKEFDIQSNIENNISSDDSILFYQQKYKCIFYGSREEQISQLIVKVLRETLNSQITLKYAIFDAKIANAVLEEQKNWKSDDDSEL